MGKGRHKRKKNKEKAEKMKNGHRSASTFKAMPQANQISKSGVMNAIVQAKAAEMIASTISGKDSE